MQGGIGPATFQVAIGNPSAPAPGLASSTRMQPSIRTSSGTLQWGEMLLGIVGICFGGY
jgi:hypothetical protein